MRLAPHLAYLAGKLHIEAVALDDIARHFGTPTYVYSQAALTENFVAYRDAAGSHDVQICYAVKANSNLSILRHLAALGAGFDIVSGGELLRVIAAGGTASRVIFSGVGKSVAEMRLALAHGIGCFNVESVAELQRLDSVAREVGVRAPVALRVNPDIDPQTHPYIATGLKDSKFGIAVDEAVKDFQRASTLSNLEVVGIACHIGSQLIDDAPLLAALDRLTGLVDELAACGIALRHLDLGGGLGIRYRDEEVVEPGTYLRRVLERIDAWRALRHAGTSMAISVEPGRSVVGNAGHLLTRVEYLKTGAGHGFAVVDAAMNDFLRPALYGAWHPVLPVVPRDAPTALWDIVGPVCESGDWLARGRDLALAEGDLLIIESTGAYGMTMASNYNSRPRPAEVMVDGGEAHVVRPREEVRGLFALEQ